MSIPEAGNFYYLFNEKFFLLNGKKTDNHTTQIHCIKSNCPGFFYGTLFDAQILDGNLICPGHEDTGFEFLSETWSDEEGQWWGKIGSEGMGKPFRNIKLG